VITQDDLDAGHVTNAATAHSNGTDSNTDTATVTADQKPALTLAKSASPSTYDHVGQEIDYSYKVTNSGNVTLAGPVTVSDNKASVSCPDVPAGGLKPGDSVTCTATYVITQDDLDAGHVTNAATAHSNGTDSNTDTATVTADQSPALSLEKTASPASYIIGTDIHYSYLVTNSGNVTLAGPVTVSDNKATVSCPDVPAGGLTPGASITCSATHTATAADVSDGSITNTAKAHSNGTDSNEAHATVTAQTVATEQNFVPNDKATLGGLGAGATGSVTFNLYQTDCTGTAIYSQTVPVIGNDSYTTTNSDDLKTLLGGAATAGTYKWQVTYSGDPDNPTNVGACGAEQFTVTNG
jgi:uncharacterized repeat protein (TIGR01451 family)